MPDGLRILLINQSHTDNIGDHAIGDVMRRFFTAHGCITADVPYEDHVEDRATPRFAARFDPRGNAPRAAARVTPLMDRWNRRRIIRLVDDAEASQAARFDAAVIGGGELLGRHYGFNSAFVSWVSVLRERGIPVFVTGVSGDARLPSPWLDRYAKALHGCEYVGVRDGATHDLVVRRYGVPARLTPDVAFTYRALHDGVPAAGRNPIAADRNRVLCVPGPFNDHALQSLHLEDRNAYCAYLADRAVRHAQDGGAHVDEFVVAATAGEDVPLLDDVAAAIGRRTRARVFTTVPADVDAYTALLPSTSAVVAGRMHAMILALQYGCTIDPIPCKDKLRTFATEYGDGVRVQDVERQSMDGLNQLLDLISASRTLHDRESDWESDGAADE